MDVATSIYHLEASKYNIQTRQFVWIHKQEKKASESEKVC